MTTRQDLRASGAGPPQGGVLVGPALAAVLVTVVADGRTGLVDLSRRALRWRVGAAWWLVVVATLALSGLGAGRPARVRRRAVAARSRPAMDGSGRRCRLGRLAPAVHTAFYFTTATRATGVVVGTLMSIAVIGWAMWVLRRPDVRRS